MKPTKGVTQMRKHARKMIAGLAILLAAGGIAACSGTNQPSALSHDATTINQGLGRLQTKEPLPRPTDSADLKIQNYLYTAEADPNKLWYLATISMSGQVLGYYTIRGPVVPASDQVTNPQQQVCAGGSNGDKNCDTVGLAEPNGIYAGNTNDHIAVTTSGAILRWEGWYQTSDQPFTLKAPVQLSLNENVTPSHTDLSTSEGGKVPQR